MGRLASKTKKRFFQTLPGTRDILPKDQPYWEKIRRAAKKALSFYGFQRIDTPMIEEADLFIRSVGGATDIVEKQMYTFKTKGGDWIALRPEATASVVRSYIQHGMSSLPHPIKLYYIGPMFRYESPQKGRYREFHQVGLEVIGERGAIAEAQIIQIFLNIFKELSLKNIGVEINSMGCGQCRPVYKKLLSGYYKTRSGQICADCRRRLKSNVLRILDCKEEKCAIIRHNAPQTVDHLCEECHNHFKETLEFLDILEVIYILNPHLVRGLDYYSKTVFEFLPTEEASASSEAGPFQSDEGPPIALGGGGRYDSLVKLLGGKDVAAAGAAIGIERVIEEMKTQGVEVSLGGSPQVFLAQLGDLGKKRSLRLFEEFRRAGIMVGESFGRDSIKAQLKVADKMGVKYALILGQKEAIEESIILREMESGSQETVPLSEIVKEVKKRLKE